jgi:hypothetical protein
VQAASKRQRYVSTSQMDLTRFAVRCIAMLLGEKKRKRLATLDIEAIFLSNIIYDKNVTNVTLLTI